ncbi:hypothetical protein [Mucilaginibacter agri]|uniref:DoxX family protein n=1 Tax=Mucilaginibacter agri TaxID=2695265 RepID=A0A965ZJJ4_9SPHI|nr:hypothetical protein [Mucilaginibacter agri]NCD70846.1 hypothetical protein [Mucilaginibacter agri]
MHKNSVEHHIYTILRLAVAMCFIGHGSFGIITKPIWANYFAVFGIGHDMAYTLMPVLGAADIFLGLIMLFYPMRAIAAWLVIWGLVTASLRPLSGEPFAELIERAGNFGASLALLILCNKEEKGFKYWFTLIKPDFEINKQLLKQLETCLKIVCFLLLAGHGWLNLIYKKGLLGQYTSLGFHDPQHVALLVGCFELAAAVIILVRPVRGLLLAFFIWKMASELLYPHWEVFEWVERGGSYGSLLALWLLLGINREPRTSQVVQPQSV